MFVQDDRQDRHQFMSFYKTPNDFINKLSPIFFQLA